MSIHYFKDTTTRLNPRATLYLCDDCRAFAPRFQVGDNQLCPLCAVRTNLALLPDWMATDLQADLIGWITTPNALLDSDDDTFYAGLNTRKGWRQKSEMLNERRARMEWVAAHTETQADRDNAYMRAFWTALLAEVDAA